MYVNIWFWLPFLYINLNQNVNVLCCLSCSSSSRFCLEKVFSWSNICYLPRMIICFLRVKPMFQPKIKNVSEQTFYHSGQTADICCIAQIPMMRQTTGKNYLLTFYQKFTCRERYVSETQSNIETWTPGYLCYASPQPNQSPATTTGSLCGEGHISTTTISWITKKLITV